MTSEGTTRSRKVLDCQVVEYVCTMIEGDLSEGVFRVPGNVRVADQLLSTFVSKEKVKEFVASHPTVTTFELASSLKRYLRDLHSPLFDIPTLALLVSAVNNIATDAAALRQAIDAMQDTQHRDAAWRLLSTLRKVADSSKVTQMDAANIGVVIAPSVFAQPHDPAAFSSALQQQAHIVAVLVERLPELLASAEQRDPQPKSPHSFNVSPPVTAPKSPRSRPVSCMVTPIAQQALATTVQPKAAEAPPTLPSRAGAPLPVPRPAKPLPVPQPGSLHTRACSDPSKITLQKRSTPVPPPKPVALGGRQPTQASNN